MTTLKHKHLLTLELKVDFAAMQNIGQTPFGLRRIVPVSEGIFSGEQLKGLVLPGADWVLNRHDGVMQIDVRLVLKTDDDELIYLTYQGRFLAGEEAMQRFAKGEVLDSAEYSLAISARFECAGKYQWLNNVIAVGTGEQTGVGPIYQFFEIG